MAPPTLATKESERKLMDARARDMNYDWPIEDAILVFAKVGTGIRR